MADIETLQKILSDFDFTLAGWTPLSHPSSIEQYRNWIERGYAGEMNYLYEHLPQKENPELLLPKAQSAILIAANYYPHPKPEPRPLKHTRVALYAQGMDYHYWLKDRLEALRSRLSSHYLEEHFLSFTDSLPVLERDLGAAAGLGWIGKNSCLINEKQGSLFFIGGLITTLKLPGRARPPDRCGTCTRCIDACPTDALVEPRVLDATRCISYLNIEAKSVAPEKLRKKMGDWLFGCDICQTVCPWNERIWKGAFDSNPVREITEVEGLENELRDILRASNRELQKKFRGTPLARPGKRLKRTAIIVAANQKLTALRTDIEAHQTHPELRELCNWALRELDPE